jgi:hypothetical protein
VGDWEGGTGIKETHQDISAEARQILAGGPDGSDTETETETDIGSPVPNVRPLISLSSDEEVIFTDDIEPRPEMDTRLSDSNSREEDIHAAVESV